MASSDHFIVVVPEPVWQDIVKQATKTVESPSARSEFLNVAGIIKKFMKSEIEPSVPNEELMRDLEKAIISLDNLRRAYRGEIKFSPTGNKICDDFIKSRRAKYNTTAKGWGKRLSKK